MGNEAWKRARFYEAGVKPLTEKQKEALRGKKEKYGELVYHLQQQIEGHKKAIGTLEKKILDERPTVENTEYVHSGCGIKTAIYYGRTPQGGMAGGDDLGYCLFCDCEYML